MSVKFEDLAIGYNVEVHYEPQSNGSIALFDFVPHDVELEKLPTLPFKIAGINKKYYNENNDVCIMVEIISPYKDQNIGWNFIDQSEMSAWKSEGWNLSGKIDLTTTLYLITYKSVNLIKSKGVSLKKYGHFCIECKDYFPYAESNTTDDRLLCYSCRTTYAWKHPNLKPAT